jgi:hypothetical protein
VVDVIDVIVLEVIDITVGKDPIGPRGEDKMRFKGGGLLKRICRMALRQSQPPHTCYYSNKCEWSEAFLKELSTTPYKGEFHFVCIDTTPRAQLPNWLKQVPTLLIKGAEEPVKVGSEVTNWLYERKMKETRSAPINAMKGATASAASMEPEAWNISEMGGKLSESYGNLVDGSGANVESSSSKNFDFGFLNGNAAPGDRTTQGIGSGGMSQQAGRSKSKKEELFDKQMDSYKQNRDAGMPQRRAAPI